MTLLWKFNRMCSSYRYLYWHRAERRGIANRAFDWRFAADWNRSSRHRNRWGKFLWGSCAVDAPSRGRRRCASYRLVARVRAAPPGRTEAPVAHFVAMHAVAERRVCPRVWPRRVAASGKPLNATDCLRAVNATCFVWCGVIVELFHGKASVCVARSSRPGGWRSRVLPFPRSWESLATALCYQRTWIKLLCVAFLRSPWGWKGPCPPLSGPLHAPPPPAPCVLWPLEPRRFCGLFRGSGEAQQ